MSYFLCEACGVWVHISERRDRGQPVLGLPDDRCFPCWRARQRELFNEMVEHAGPPPTGLLAAPWPDGMVIADVEIGDPLRFDSHGSFDLEPEDGDGHDDW